jgi:hypothetical protein
MNPLTPKQRLLAEGLDEIQRRFQKALAEGDLDEAAKWLDLKLSVSDPRKPRPVATR